MRIVTIGLDQLEQGILPFSSVLHSVEAGLDLAANQVKEKMLEPTSTFSIRPVVEIEKAPLKREIFTTDQKYIWLDQGTRPHVIEARNPRGRLKFQGRTPKTTPFNFTASQGGSNGEVQFAKRVQHPGTDPRGWTELIEYLFGDFSGGGRLKAILQNAINQKL